jgi:hypothetical protein
VQPFRKGQLVLQPSMTLEEATVTCSSNSPYPHTRMMVIGTGRIYALDGNQTIRTSASVGSAWATVTGTPAVNFTDMCHDGQQGLFAFKQSGGTSTIYVATGTSVASTYTLAGADITALGFVKGRLMVGDSAGKLYNPTSTGALPAALMTLPTGGGAYSGEWLGFAEGNSHIYGAARLGSSGGRSYVYRTAVKPDGTALDVPIIAAELPNNESIAGIGSRGVGRPAPAAHTPPTATTPAARAIATPVPRRARGRVGRVRSRVPVVGQSPGAARGSAR